MSVFELNTPQRVIYGPGSLARLPEICQGRVCLIIDPFFREQAEALRVALNAVCVIDEIAAEPTFSLIHALWARYPLAQVDCYVAIGGGSVMDVTKILSAITANPGFLDALTDPSQIVRDPVPWVGVPTTAGTGAEATPNAILLDEEKREKIGIVSPRMIARCVVLDGELLGGLPSAIAASTGLDAFAHALESFLSRKESPFGDFYALEALRLIFENLTAAVCENSLPARQNMLLAAYYAGICLVARGTSALHAMAYPLSGWYHVPHGVSIATLLLPVLRAMAPDCRARLAYAARRLNLSSDAADETAAQTFMQNMEALVAGAYRPVPMAQYGVTADRHEAMAESALAIRRLFDLSPKVFEKSEVVKIYNAVL